MSTRLPLALALTLAVAACAPGSPAAPGSSATPAPGASTAMSTPAPAENNEPANFVPTKFTLKVDGKDVTLNQKGFTSSRTATILAASLGTFKGEKAGTSELYGPSINVMSSGKTIGASDFTKADAASTVIGLNWVRNLTVRTYIADPSATITLKGTGDKLDLTYNGKMNRGPGSGDFPESIMVDLTIEGIPTK